MTADRKTEIAVALGKELMQQLRLAGVGEDNAYVAFDGSIWIAEAHDVSLDLESLAEAVLKAEQSHAEQ